MRAENIPLGGIWNQMKNATTEILDREPCANLNPIPISGGANHSVVSANSHDGPLSMGVKAVNTVKDAWIGYL